MDAGERDALLATWARILRRCTRDPETGCWRSGHVHDWGGYALAWHVDRMTSAHRVSYALSSGLGVAALTRANRDPGRMEVDHHYAAGCRYRDCVNPAHLRLVTNLENTRAGERANRTHCPRGHALRGGNLRPSSIKRGQRECLTCHRAAGRVASAARRGRAIDPAAALAAVMEKYPEVTLDAIN